MKENNRLQDLDILKFIGILCIILAHVEPNGVVFQIRNFDVVLMIIISARLFFTNSPKIENIKEYLKYVWKRIYRLVIPTYVFLTILFLLNYIFKFQDWSFKNIIGSYALKNGIGYVWIIRIYLLIALLLPVCKNILNKTKNTKVYIIGIVMFIIYEILCMLGINDSSLMQYIVAYIVPCVFLILISHWIMNSDNQKVILFGICNLIIFIILGFIIYQQTGKIQNTNYMKYPFRAYYLSYALFVSSILIVIFRNKKVVKIVYNRFIEFVAKHSLWIYLWHILFLQVFKFEYWILNYILVVLFAVLITFVQSLIINFLEDKGINKKVLKIFNG